MYKQLKNRIDQGDVILLDGAVGTQLQAMQVPMDNTAWAAAALHTHPDTVRLMHSLYLNCNVDIVTTNTYSSARHNLEPLGLGGATCELNYRAVNLAQQAIERCGHGRAITLAGSISNFGLVLGGEEIRSLHRHARPRSVITEEQARENLREQAVCLAEAGVDFLLLESTGSMTHRHWLVEECGHAGLPMWLGFRCRLDEGDETPRVGFSSADSLADGVAAFDGAGLDGIALFHSTIAATDAGIDAIRSVWSGPLAAYPESDRSDYTLPQRDDSVTSNVTPDEFPAIASRWIEQGVQVIGGCCGINLEYMENLKSKLPTRVSATQ